jgi:hypothetical protein
LKNLPFIALIFLLSIGIYRYLPVFGIGVLGITVFEKVGIFAIPKLCESKKKKTVADGAISI